ncbi:hypothetical protein FANTH_10742 [Fusarium anthophilum]|uniref:Uncharacterized protein n=1 Tax=Fusarium anthophilum TaxID=48485 RepID=A0A8H4Z0C2_9HYPO|nr:hypothetical protein FANTH_10742 [Fusarium anthophilum]
MDYSSILSKPKSFFGKQKVWMAHGEDLALFNTHRSNIQNLLRHSCIPESSHNLWIGLYQIGASKDDAKTFVVVSCSNRRIRKLTRDLLSSCPMFQPGGALDRFKVISKATLPETSCEPRQAMQDEEELECEVGLRKGDKGKNTVKDEYKTIRISPSITGDSYLCRQVQARQVSGNGEVRFQTATAGPLINLDGRTYQLTVAHVVNFQEKDTHDATESTTDDWDDWDDENDDDTDRSCSVDEDVASWDISADDDGTPASDVSDDEVPGSLSSNSFLEVATQENESGTPITEETSTVKEPTDESFHPRLSERPVLEEFLIDHATSYLGFAPGPENCQISMELDYLLIPIRADLQTGVCETEPRQVIIATASLGYMEGVVFPSSSLLRPPGSKDFQTLYCIKSGNALPTGTSGSAVFDKRTGLLAGYIVLGLPEKNIWYMVPILDILNDLEVRFRQKGKCQTRLDVDAAMRLGDQRAFSNTTPPKLLEASQVSQGGSLMLMNGKYDRPMVLESSKMTKLGILDKSKMVISKGFQRQKPACLNHWKSQFGHDANAPERGVLLLAEFRKLETAFLQEKALMLPDPVKAFGESEIKSEALKVGSHNRRDGLHPTARMLNIFEPLNKGKAVSKRDLSESLQLKNLSPISPDNTTNTLNCLYLKNPDTAAIMALLKSTSRFPMKGLQEIFYNSITTQPCPIIDLNQDTWLESPCFIIVISLPYLVISNHDKSHTESVATGTALRSRFSFSFLNTQDQSYGTQQETPASHTDKEYPYMASWSTIVTGISDRYWTAVCLDDDFFDNEERTADGDSEDSILVSRGSEQNTVDTKRPMSPRAYTLQALATQLDRICAYHKQAQLRFATDLRICEEKWNGLTDEHLLTDEQLHTLSILDVLELTIRLNSKLIERVDDFLSKDIHRSPEDELGHSLWEGVDQEPGASDSLQRIRDLLSMIRDTESRLKILRAAMKVWSIL